MPLPPPSLALAESRELIEKIEVRCGVEQDLMLVLTVKIDEAAARLADHGGGHQSCRR